MPEPAATSRRPLITVAGDIIIDHHLYEGERRSATSEGVRGVTEVQEPGGAALIHQLLQHIQPKEAPGPVILGTTVPDPHRHGDQHAFAIWKPYPRDAREAKSASVWRANLVMGYGQDQHGTLGGSSIREKAQPYTPQPTTTATTAPAPRVLVLDDAGNRFRHREHADCWLLPRKGRKAPDWVVLKTSAPVAAGDLWTEVNRRYSDRLVCLVSANDLRREGVQLGIGLSWERTIEELRSGLDNIPTLSGLKRCRHLVIQFSVDGVLWIERHGAESAATLICDAAGAEEEFGRRYSGRAFGYMSCLVASVANALASAPVGKRNGIALAPAIAAGLDAMRDLLAGGHGPVSDVDPTGYPAARLADILAPRTEASPEKPAPHRMKPAIISIPWGRSPQRGSAIGAPPWMIVEMSQRPRDAGGHPSLIGLARQLVLRGPAILDGLPHATFGKLLTADRAEIEALRAIRRAMQDYRETPRAGRPLSIGVFGPPGAGKSFGVKQLATDIYGAASWMEFNLSQFSGPDDLIGAFHQVRDAVLGGVTPVVFWDEFDAGEFEWLPLLLAPMQDGRFQQRNLTHAIGKCVFVFAGGTRHSYGEFKAPPATEAERARFVLTKGPDFASRLDEYLDVLGPNQRTLAPNPKAAVRKPDPSDVCHSLRRAILIRSLLATDRAARVDIESDLLDALLAVPKYHHGARSLEKLVRALHPDPTGAIRRAALPSPRTLAMHVNEAALQALLDRNTAFRMTSAIEAMASVIHTKWWKERKPGELANRLRLDKPYDKLAPADKEDNRAAARRIPDVLALAGLRIEKRSAAAKGADRKQLMQHLNHHMERLAEAEHDGWMEHKVRLGWSFAAVRNDEKKQHDCLVPYLNLPEGEKDKDRDKVLAYPEIVAAAGYVVRFWQSGT